MISVLASQRFAPSGRLHRGLCAAAAFLACIPGSTLAATITVTGTGDTVAVDGIVTLREAIMSINAGASVNADVVPVGAYGTSDTINFNIAGAGVHTIAPSPALPNITKPVTINGYSQPGSSANTNGPLLRQQCRAAHRIEHGWRPRLPSGAPSAPSAAWWSIARIWMRGSASRTDSLPSPEISSEQIRPAPLPGPETTPVESTSRAL